jgi:hypothetical protein
LHDKRAQHTLCSFFGDPFRRKQEGRKEGLRRVKEIISLTILRIFGAEAAPKIRVGGFFCLFFMDRRTGILTALHTPPTPPKKTLPLHPDGSRQG